MNKEIHDPVNLSDAQKEILNQLKRPGGDPTEAVTLRQFYQGYLDMTSKARRSWQTFNKNGKFIKH